MNMKRSNGVSATVLVILEVPRMHTLWVSVRLSETGDVNVLMGGREWV